MTDYLGSHRRLKPGETDAFLGHVGWFGSRAPSFETLRGVTRRCALAIPFETLDGPEGVRPAITTEAAFDKIVNKNRGGACLEVNNVLAGALEELGFAVRRLSSRPWLSRLDGFSPVDDHMVMMTTVDDEDYLVDSSYAYQTALSPIPMDGRVVTEGPWQYRITNAGTSVAVVERRGVSGDWHPAHRFSYEARDYSYYENIYNHHFGDTDGLKVTSTLMCARAFENGRLSLVNTKLHDTRTGGHVRATITSRDAAESVLRMIFGGYDNLALRALRIWDAVVAPSIDDTMRVQNPMNSTF